MYVCVYMYTCVYIAKIGDCSLNFMVLCQRCLMNLIYNCTCRFQKFVFCFIDLLQDSSTCDVDHLVCLPSLIQKHHYRLQGCNSFMSLKSLDNLYNVGQSYSVIQTCVVMPIWLFHCSFESTGLFYMSYVNALLAWPMRATHMFQPEILLSFFYTRLLDYDMAFYTGIVWFKYDMSFIRERRGLGQ